MTMEVQPITPAFPGLPTEMVFKILADLDDRTLLSCRLVSQGWCEATSTILQSRPTVIAELRCFPVAPSKNDTLADFIECAKESQKFGHLLPYSNFVFRGFNQDISECRNIETFFSLSRQSNSGLLIKSFRASDINQYQPAMNILKSLLFEGAPNLRILGLSFERKQQSGQLIKSKQFSNSKQPAFPSLQIVQLENVAGATAVDFITDVMRDAPNLQRIEGPYSKGFQGGPYAVLHPDQLQVIIDSKKIHLVKQCSIWLYEELVASEILTREKLSGFRPTLLTLTLEEFSTNQSSTWVRNLDQTKLGLVELFWTVKDSVEELRTENSLGLLDKSNLPRFSKLKLLHWNLYKLDYPLLPPGINSRDSFPKLEKISVSLLGDEDRIFPNLTRRRRTPVIPFVDTLVVQPFATFTGKSMKTMALMCPNLRSLELSHAVPDGVNFSLVGPHIWENMRGLKILILNNELLWKENSFEMAEAGFTGFSLQTVRQLTDSEPEDQPRVEDVERLRVNLSILQLTELEKLVIKVDPVNRRNEAPELPLSCKYAFELMPGLTVKISSSDTAR